MSGQRPVISRRHIRKREVSHYMDYVGKSCRVPCKVVIPTFDRPDVVCATTLSLLKRQGVDLSSVALFVSPDRPPQSKQPEWERYLLALRKHDMMEVQLLSGGSGLTGNMIAAMTWVKEGYFLTMSDRVSEIFHRVQLGANAPKLVPAPIGTLPALIAHGYDMMKKGGFVAWSVNPAKNVMMLRDNVLSCRLGLLDGNLTGCLLPANWQSLQVRADHGLIYDVEWTVRLWASNRKFFRYAEICVQHPYRSHGGQRALYPNGLRRRVAENGALHRLAVAFPKLIEIISKPRCTLKTMLYRFKHSSEPPIKMLRGPQVGRRRKHVATRAMTPAERKRKQREMGTGQRMHRRTSKTRTKRK